MTQNPAGGDIFEGAERIELLGKLPSLLWAYIHAGREMMALMSETPTECSGAARNLKRVLGVLGDAAVFLGNQELKGRVEGHLDMLNAWTEGTLTEQDFRGKMTKDLVRLEELAGPRVERGLNEPFTAMGLERELDKYERIKAGRSADVVVSVELLNEIREFLTNKVLTEGISTILVIDNAGTLIANVGHKTEVDAVSLAAVAAANFAATEKIAHLIGENEFVLLFYKGHNESFHFRRVGREYIIVTIFNNSLSLGLLRLKLSEVAQALESKLPKRQG